MFRAGRSRSFKELMFRGALSLICCAIAALCVGGALSALAENLGPKAPANDVDRTPCKTINCVLKSKGPRLAHSEERSFHEPKQKAPPTQRRHDLSPVGAGAMMRTPRYPPGMATDLS